MASEVDSLELARHIVDVLADKKGESIVLLDIGSVSILADYFVIASSASSRQSRAMMNDIKLQVKESFDVKPLRIEGEADSGWVLMDYGSVVVHVFEPEVRSYYDLEGLWRDGRVVVRML